MKKVLIYPFGKESEFIAEHFDMLKNLYPVCLVGLRGWDNGKKEYAVNSRQIPLVYDFMEGLEAYEPEIVWFVEFSKQIDFETEYLPYIKLAIDKKKRIILSDSLKKKVQKYILDLSDWLYCSKEIRSETKKCGDFLKPINTPVVCLCSLYGNLCKFELQLMLRKELIKREISFVQIGTKDFSEEFGFFNVPWFMVDEDISDKDKTLMFNRYLKEIEETEKPDLIVIGVPGEMCAASETYVAGFGYLARDYFYAVKPDIVIMSVPYSLFSNDDLNYISRGIRNRFGSAVDVFCRTNKHLLLEDTELEQDFTYLTVNKEDLKENIVTENLYDLEQNQVSKITDIVLNKLKTYGQIESI